MKTLKMSLLALVFTVGIGGALVQKIHAAPKKEDDTFNWQKTDVNGNVITGGAYQSGKTMSEAQGLFDCSGSTTPCAAVVNHQNGTKVLPATYIDIND